VSPNAKLAIKDRSYIVSIYFASKWYLNQKSDSILNLQPFSNFALRSWLVSLNYLAKNLFISRIRHFWNSRKWKVQKFPSYVYWLRVVKSALSVNVTNILFVLGRVRNAGTLHGLMRIQIHEWDSISKFIQEWKKNWVSRDPN